MPTSESNDVIESGPPTEEVHTDTTAQVPVVSTPNPAEPTSEADSLFVDEPDEWPTQGPAKGVRMPWLAALLLVLLVASVGIWGGAYMQRHSSSSTSSAASAFPFALGRSSSGGTSALTKALANITSGTVTDIIGDTLYVTTSSGNLVAVKVGSTTTIDRNAKSSLSSLKPGDTVTVQGTKSATGSVTAASVSATQSGVSTTGGFGGFGGFGGSSGASGAPSGVPAG